LPADRRRSRLERPVRRGSDGHPDQLHVEARLPGRKGQRLRPREHDLDPDLPHRRDDLGRQLLEDQGAGEPQMSTLDQPIARPAAEAQPEARKLVPRRRPPLRDTWWRHLVAWVAIVISLFPVAYIFSAAFSANASLEGSSLIPAHVTLENFRHLFYGSKAVSEQIFASVHYWRWYAN